MGISENIRGLRKMRGYSQVFLAKLLKVDKCTVSAWENGFQKPNSDNICALAKIFRISADELLGLKESAAGNCIQEFGLEFRPEFKQEFNLDIERQAGLRLSDLMEEKGMSRSDLAKALDVTPKTVCNWESKGMPGLKHYQKVFTIFNLDNTTFQALR